MTSPIAKPGIWAGKPCGRTHTCSGTGSSPGPSGGLPQPQAGVRRRAAAVSQSWTDSPLYATKNLERTRAFFRFCHQAGWIEENPAKVVKPPKVTPDADTAICDEMKRIVKACDEMGAQGAHQSVRVDDALHGPPHRRRHPLVERPGGSRNGLRPVLSSSTKCDTGLPRGGQGPRPSRKRV